MVSASFTNMPMSGPAPSTTSVLRSNDRTTMNVSPVLEMAFTRCQRPAPMFCPAMLLTAEPSVCAGIMMMLWIRWAAPKPATTVAPNEATTLMITTCPLEMATIWNPPGRPSRRTAWAYLRSGTVGRVNGTRPLRRQMKRPKRNAAP